MRSPTITAASCAAGGRAVKQRVESLTDDLAAKPYESLEPAELTELIDNLQPLATLLLAAQDFG